MNFIIAILMQIGNFILNVLDDLYHTIDDWYQWRFNPPPLPDYITVADLPPVPKELSVSQDGLVYDGYRRGTLSVAHRHAAIAGNSGSGKSTIAEVNFLVDSGCSIISIDPDKEKRKRYSGFLESVGYQIRVLDLSNTYGDYLNPFQFTKTDAERNNLSAVTVQSQMGNSGDVYWRLAAQGIFAHAANILARYGPEYCSYENVRLLLEMFLGDQQKADVLALNTNDPKIKSTHRRYAKYSPGHFASIAGSALSTTEFLVDENVRRLLSATTFDPAELRNRKTALFIHSKITEQRAHAGLTAVLVESITNQLLDSVPSVDDLSIRLVAEELAEVPIRSMPQILAVGRKYKLSVLYIMQSWNSLKKTYGIDVESLKSNTFVKVAFGNNMPLAEAREIEAYFGDIRIETERGIRTEKLMPVSFLRDLPPRFAILQYGGKPTLIRTRPYYVQRRYRRRSKIPPALIAHRMPENQCKPISELINRHSYV